MMRWFKRWINRHGWVLMTDDEYTENLCRVSDMARALDSASARSIINPVLNDLEKLRRDTWNQDKITHIQKWLRDNFEV